MDTLGWATLILDTPSEVEVWKGIFQHLLEIAIHSVSPNDLHKQTVTPDRFLAECAWELWSKYSQSAELTAARLRDWYLQRAVVGRAVLILDALSLRELRVLLECANAHGIEPL